ncbi:ABC transporter substrate-binding protein [Saliphagus sp. GCM10025334]
MAIDDGRGESSYRISRREMLAVTGATGITALAGCSSGGEDSEHTTVTVGTTETGSLGVLTEIIKDRGIDNDHGIEFDVEPTDPASAAQLLQNEAVDTSVFSPQGAATANTEGSDIRLYGPALSNHNAIMTTSNNDDISGMEDLVGKAIGIMPSPSGMWNHMRLLLAEMGLDYEEDFDLRTGAPGGIHGFNARGDVAAHGHFIPVTVTSEEAGDMRPVFYFADRFEEIYGHNLALVPFATRQSYIDENPDAARAARDAIIEAQQLFNDDPAGIIDEYRDVIGLENQEQVDIAAEQMPAAYTGEWGQDAVDRIVQQLERSKELGLIPSDAPTEDIVVDI